MGASFAVYGLHGVVMCALAAAWDRQAMTVKTMTSWCDIFFSDGINPLLAWLECTDNGGHSYPYNASTVKQRILQQFNVPFFQDDSSSKSATRCISLSYSFGRQSLAGGAARHFNKEFELHSRRRRRLAA